MHQKDPFKVEVWLDSSYYSKMIIPSPNYNIAVLVEEIKSMIRKGLIPVADKIEIRQARI